MPENKTLSSRELKTLWNFEKSVPSCRNCKGRGVPKNPTNPLFCISGNFAITDNSCCDKWKGLDGSELELDDPIVIKPFLASAEHLGRLTEFLVDRLDMNRLVFTYKRSNTGKINVIFTEKQTGEEVYQYVHDPKNALDMELPSHLYYYQRA